MGADLNKHYNVSEAAVASEAYIKADVDLEVCSSLDELDDGHSCLFDDNDAMV